MSKLKPGDAPPHVPLFVITGFKEDNLAKHDKLLPMLMLWASEVSHEGLAQVSAGSHARLCPWYCGCLRDEVALVGDACDQLLHAE